MILTSITLTDFGTFQGQQELELRPKPGRPIVLFGGKNGAGKSTILDAIRLGFYGQASLGSKFSKEQYLSYLESRIHRNPNSIIQASYSSISLEFEFSDPDGVHLYRITRSWERTSAGKIVETFDVQRDKQPLDQISADHWQDFIRDLVPIGVSQLFFFDGEKIQQLAEDSSDEKTLAEAIKLLLGVDLVERLDADLGIYVSRTAVRKAKPEEQDLIASLESESLNQEKMLVEDRVERERQLSLLNEIKGSIDLHEQRLSSSGGSFVRNRESLLKEEQQIAAEISQIRSSLRELCGGLLPFALAPTLCKRLKVSLMQEETEENRRGAQEFARKARTRLKQVLISGKSAPLKRLNLVSRRKLAEDLAVIFDGVTHSRSSRSLHESSTAERRVIFSWLSTIQNELPMVVADRTRRLEQLTRNELRVKTGLKKIPPEESIRPLLTELQVLYQKLAEINHGLSVTEEKIRVGEASMAAVTRRIQQERENLTAGAERESRLHVVPKIRSVLEEFKSTLIYHKVRQLEEAVTECFNILCRKKDSLRRISIDPLTFKVTLKDRDGQPIPKVQLSAGEKQIYAISMLWALAKTSGRPLPIVIDTPLARLDRDHRDLLATHYFKNASHQVIVLSTDTEVDETYFEKLSSSISRAYLLDFSEDERRTKVTPGYFWRRQHEALEAAAQ
jgi:DNA sulfur modification protein DndD